jgi:hypothetical protein
VERFSRSNGSMTTVPSFMCSSIFLSDNAIFF